MKHIAQKRSANKRSANKRSANKRSADKRSAKKRSVKRRPSMKISEKRVVQNIEFDKIKWSFQKAKEWLYANNYQYIDVDETRNKFIFIFNNMKLGKIYKTIPVGTNTGIKIKIFVK